MMFLLLILGLASASDSDECSHWSYSSVPGECGPAEWYLVPGTAQCEVDGETGSCCSIGTQQSPIDIPMYTTLGYKDASLSHSLNTTNGYFAQMNGHSVVISANDTTGMETVDENQEVWQFLQAHFHWGPDSTSGSEHTINGVAYPAEIHFVHYHSSLDAADALDDLLVVGVFFEEAEELEDETASTLMFDRIEEAFSSFMWNDTSTAVSLADDFDLSDFLPNALTSSEYYMYNGSLTTPTCDETVDWKVLNITLKIRSSQLDAFRAIQYDDYSDAAPSALDYNYRSTFAPGDRVVLQTFFETELDAESVEDYTISKIISAVMLFFIGILLFGAAALAITAANAKKKKKAANAANQ